MKNNSDVMTGFLLGLGAGAALMYVLDPDRGRRRRALIHDKAVALSHDASDVINKTAKDLSNRAYGIAAEASKAVTGKAIDEVSSAER